MVRKRFGLFDVMVYLIIIFMTIVTIYPILNVASISMSTVGSFLRNPMMAFPTELDFSAYTYLFQSRLMIQSYWNTIVITVVGTLLSLFLTISLAYPLSRKTFMATPAITYMMVITMLINGGLIPNFYLIRSLGMYNTMSALIIPGSLSAFNVILLVNFFKSVPETLLEAARIDGASEFQVLMRIMLPLSTAIIATLTLFNAVGRWNSFFNAIIYIRDRNKWTLQLLLREMLMALGSPFRMPDDSTNIQPQSVRYAAIVITALPIVMVYPFLQKYFAKGVMLGSIKE